MASTFAGLQLFNSGPHRFKVTRVGRLTRPPLTGGNQNFASADYAKAELEIVQEGRLTAATESALWTLVDAIRTQAELPRTGTLVDHSGRSWPGMTLHRFEPAYFVDRGRVFSMAYAATYLDFGP